MIFQIFFSDIIFLLFAIISNTSKVFKIKDVIFLNPENSNYCGIENYWTPFDQNTSCYKFHVLTDKDTENKTEIQLILDHNVANGIFDEINGVITTIKSKWVKLKNSKIDIIDEETIYKLMNFTKKPTLNTSVSNSCGGCGSFFGNSRYIINFTVYEDYGYWTKTPFSENKSYIYTINSNGANALVLKTNKRGIRPVITIKKEIIKNVLIEKNITDFLMNNSKIYKFPKEQKYNTYGGLQGSVVTKDKIVFGAVSSNVREHSVLYSFTGENFTKLYKTIFAEIYHANGMTYNPKTNKIYVLGGNNGTQTNVYNGNTLQYERALIYKDGYMGFSGIGYDEKTGHYAGFTARNFHIIEENNPKKSRYHFKGFSFQTTQDICYHNGYLFEATTELGIGTYQTYSSFKRLTSLIYVFNAKLDKNGIADKNFGRLVSILLTEKPVHELEGISIINNKVYLGFATSGDYPFVFYEIDYNKWMKTFIKEESIKEDNYFSVFGIILIVLLIIIIILVLFYFFYLRKKNISLSSLKEEIIDKIHF